MDGIKKKMAALKEERDNTLSELYDARAEIKEKIAQNDSVSYSLLLSAVCRNAYDFI